MVIYQIILLRLIYNFIIVIIDLLIIIIGLSYHIISFLIDVVITDNFGIVQ